MLNSRPLRGQGFRDSFKVLLTIRFEGAEMVVWYRMTSAEMWVRSVIPGVYSAYMIRRSWSTQFKAWPLRPAVSRLMNSCEALGRNARTNVAIPTVSLHSFENNSPIDVRRETRIVRYKDHRPGLVF